MKLFLCFLLFNADLIACTGILLHTENREIVTGRTVEFGENIEMSVAVIPRKYRFVGKLPSGTGLSYEAKYAAAGIYCFDQQVLMDGINEKGLVAAAFYFPGYASYAQITPENRMQAISPIEFPNWVLTQFATIDELKKALDSIVIAPTSFKSWGSEPPPMHYIVYDRTGKSLVIEPTDGKLFVYENPIGTITNSPQFDWQLTNLSNYINLSAWNIPPKEIGDLTMTSFGQGSGLLGLPGDFTPPSRFVRAAIFSTTAIPSKSSQEAVDQAFHILNQFDIPYGSVRGKEQGQTTFDYTLLTSVKDPQNLRYYYRSYVDQTIRFIDLKQFEPESHRIKYRQVHGKQKTVDVSSQLQ